MENNYIKKDIKVKEDGNLVEGEYYYLWLSDEKQFTVPVHENENNGQNIQYEYVPVIAAYEDGKLIDIISSYTYYTLNPLKAYRNSSFLLVNHAIKLKREDLYKESNRLHEMSELEKEKYKEKILKSIENLKDDNSSYGKENPVSLYGLMYNNSKEIRPSSFVDHNAPSSIIENVPLYINGKRLN